MIYTISYDTHRDQISVRVEKVAGEQGESATATFSVLELEAARLHIRRPIVEMQLRQIIPWPVPQRVVSAVVALVE